MDGRIVRRNGPNPTDWAVGAGGPWASSPEECAHFTPSPPRGRERACCSSAPRSPASRPLAQGVLQEMRRKNRALPAAMCWPSATKVILYLRKGEGYEKNFPLQGFTFGGKMPGLTGSYQGGCHKSPFVPPTSADNGTERNYLFSKRLSGRPSQAGLFPCGWESGVG